MSRKQEQEPARSEVTQVAPGVLRMQLPIRMPGLGHVNMYALLDDRGAAVVDPGLPGRPTWRVIVDRLKQADLRVRDVHTVIVTHSHPDHFGGAARFARESGAVVVAHERFRFGAVVPSPEPEVSVEDLAAHRAARDGESPAEDGAPAPGSDAQNDGGPAPGSDAQNDGGPAPGSHAQGDAEPGHGPHVHAAGDAVIRRWRGRTPWGGESPRPSLKMRLRWRLMRALGHAFVPTVTRTVKDGDVLRLCGRDFSVIHTPGHTEDHFCLHDPEEGLFLAGDHVLPSITPHISGLSTERDPLDSFFESLTQVGALEPVSQALPAHGHPFSDLYARTEAIKRHHVERLEKVKAIGRSLGPASVEAFSQRLFKPRSWGSMAESETYAHLEHLRHAGDAVRSLDREGRFLYETG